MEKLLAGYAIDFIYFTDMKNIRIRNVLIGAYALIIAGILFLFALNGRYDVQRNQREVWYGVDKWTGMPVYGTSKGVKVAE